MKYFSESHYVAKIIEAILKSFPQGTIPRMLRFHHLNANKLLIVGNGHIGVVHTMWKKAESIVLFILWLDLR